MNLIDGLSKDNFHGMWQLTVNGNPELANYIRRVVTNQWTNSTEYSIRQSCGAFLQGWQDDGSWCMVEFWKNDHDRILEFVQFIEANFKAEKS